MAYDPFIWCAALAMALPALGAEPFRAERFGAKGDGASDDGRAIQRMIDAAIAAGAGAEVRLEAGRTYRLAAREDDVTALRIGEARGLTFSGNGATLLVHPSNRPLAIHNSREIAIRDLVIDYHPLPYTQARLSEGLLADGAVRFRVDAGYDAPTIAGVEVYRDFKRSDAVFIDGDTRKFTHDWARIREVKAAGDGVYEARFHGDDIPRRLARVKAGDWIAIKQHYPEPKSMRGRDGRFLTSSAANVYIGFSQDVRIERLTSYAAPVMTIVATGSEGVVLDGCRVVRKPGTDRLIAGCSDGAHLKSLTVMPQVRNCVFEALMDDSINIKISSEVVKEVAGRRVRLAHGDIFTDDCVIEPGQSLQFVSAGKKEHLGVAKVAGVERIGYREVWVTLESPPEKIAVGDLAYLRPATEAVVSGCAFRSQLKTALLIRPPSRITDCAFADIAYGVHAFINDSIEGPPPFGLRISRCVFECPSVAGIALSSPSTASAPPGTQALVAEECRFVLGAGRGIAVGAANQVGITLRNVRISPAGRPPDEAIRLRNCTLVRQEGGVLLP